MPRPRKSVYERGVCVRLPSLLLDGIEALAKDEFPPQSRSDAMRELLERGLRELGRWPPRKRPSRA
jgi:hypothetical protein